MLKLPSLGHAPSQFSSLYFTEVLGSKEAGGRRIRLTTKLKGQRLNAPSAHRGNGLARIPKTLSANERWTGGFRPPDRTSRRFGGCPIRSSACICLKSVHYYSFPRPCWKSTPARY